MAKCFGLRDSPKTIREHDDTISKIFNGQYSAALKILLIVSSCTRIVLGLSLKPKHFATCPKCKD